MDISRTLGIQKTLAYAMFVQVGLEIMITLERTAQFKL
jgi:hypothetical protein